jgi:4-diphosphocytidyl-2-C-methyl-D-erythritol kinase
VAEQVAPLVSDLLVADAPAKVNLTLHVLGRRPDNYHEITSLVVFARLGDRLTLAPGSGFALSVSGPTAASAGDIDSNLVLKAARALDERIEGLTRGRFVLVKELPVAAGLGGGSADAAAALRLLARANGLSLDDPRLREAARATGADVPVCLDPRPRTMRGIGEKLSEPLDLPSLPAVLVNPRVAVPTKDVFAALAAPALGAVPEAEEGTRFPASPAGLIEQVAAGRNDLEPPAIKVAPVIAEVLAALRALPGCCLARMSGSGATCFGLFDTDQSAAAGAKTLRAAHPTWWVEATTFGSHGLRRVG